MKVTKIETRCQLEMTLHAEPARKKCNAEPQHA